MVTRFRLIGTLLGAAALVAVAGTVAYQLQAPRVRARLVAMLSERLDSDVQLGDLQVRLGATVQVSGQALVVRHRLYHDVPPLVRVERFVVEFPIAGVFRTPVHISSVQLEGLRIFIPPKGKRDTALGDLKASLHGPSPVVFESDHGRRGGARDRLQQARPRA